MTDLDSTLRGANAQWKGESEKLAGGDISGPTFIARSELSDSGPRKCKDIAWLAVFLLFLFGNVVILGLAALSGDPYKLVFGVEYTGQVCGGSYSTDSTLEFSKRLNDPPTTAQATDPLPEALGYTQASWSDYYTKSARTVYPQFETDILINQQSGWTIPQFFGICATACPAKDDIICGIEARYKLCKDYKASNSKNTCIGDEAAAFNAHISTTVSACNETSTDTVCSTCWKMPYGTKNVLNRCVPFTNSTTVNMCLYPVGPNGLPWEIKDAEGDKFCKVKQATTTVTGAALPNELVTYFNSGSEYVEQWFGDIYITMTPVFVTGVIFSIILGYVWLWGLKNGAGFVAWITLFLSVILMLGLTLTFFAKAGLLGTASQLEFLSSSLQSITGSSTVAGIVPGSLPAVLQASSTNTERFKWGGIVMATILVVTVFLIYQNRQRINLAAAIMVEASKCLDDMPSLVFWPILTFTLTTLVGVFFAVSAGYIASMRVSDLATTANNVAGGLEQAMNSAAALMEQKTMQYANKTISFPNFANRIPRVVEVDNSLVTYFLLYHLFVSLWVGGFIQASGLVVVAGAVCWWYWKEHPQGLDNSEYHEEMVDCDLKCCKVKVTKVSTSPIFNSLDRLVKYNLGSVAQGSLLLTLCRIAITILEYLNWSTEWVKGDFVLVKYYKMCVGCLLQFLDTTLKFIQRYAYIMVAMTGDSFCDSGVTAFGLIWDNMGKVAVINTVGDFVLFLGKISVTLLVGSCCWMWIEFSPSYSAQYYPGPPTSIIPPVLLTCVLTWFIVSSFSQVYEMAIDSILLCFCRDKVVNEGGPYIMSDRLKQFIEAREMDPMNMRPGESAVFSKKIVQNGILSFGIGWEMNKAGKGAVGGAVQQDLDCACLVLKDGKMLAPKSFVDWRQKSLYDGALKLSNDNREGQGQGPEHSGTACNEYISINLNHPSFPKDANGLAFVLIVYKGEKIGNIDGLVIEGMQKPQKPAGAMMSTVCRFATDMYCRSADGFLINSAGDKIPDSDDEDRFYLNENSKWQLDNEVITDEAMIPIKDPKSLQSEAYLFAKLLKGHGDTGFWSLEATGFALEKTDKKKATTLLKDVLPEIEHKMGLNRYSNKFEAANMKAVGESKLAEAAEGLASAAAMGVAM